MDSGELDRRVGLLRLKESRNGLGEAIEEHEFECNLWAKKRDVSSRERLAVAEQNARGEPRAGIITTRFTVRWSSLSASITPRDRFELDGVQYDLMPPREIGRRHMIEFDAVARFD